MAPISLRLDKELHRLLAEGVRKTPLRKQDLIRRTLRRYLQEVIAQETNTPVLTNVPPLTPGVMRKVYRRLAQLEPEWDQVEAQAVKAQGYPSWDD